MEFLLLYTIHVFVSDLDQDYVVGLYPSSDSDYHQKKKPKKEKKRKVVADNIQETTARFIKTMIETCVAQAFDKIGDKFTKKGKIRKRKTYADSVAVEERKLIAQN